MKPKQSKILNKKYKKMKQYKVCIKLQENLIRNYPNQQEIF